MQHTVSLKQNHEFRRLYNRGKSAVSPYFAIYCRKTGRDYSRLAKPRINAISIII